MNISLEKILELYGISQVRIALMEEEIERLRKELTKEKEQGE